MILGSKRLYSTHSNAKKGLFALARDSENNVNSSNQENPAFSQKNDQIGSAKNESLSHVDLNGKASMVAVGHKESTKRQAVAEGFVHMNSEAFRLLVENKNKKGDVLTVAQIAGINAAKQTGYLIPLCHPLLLTSIKVTLEPNSADQYIHITSEVECDGKTGVEVEAIMAVTVAAVTVYDMCKAVDKSISITDVRLLTKSGGKSGGYHIGSCLDQGTKLSANEDLK